jgi:hypothetical protein
MNLLSQAADRIAASSPRSVEARAILERLARLNQRDGHTLTHALSVAAERFDQDAATMLEQKRASEAALEQEPGARLMFHPAACEQLAGQFRQQAADVRELIATLEGDDEEGEESAAA